MASNNIQEGIGLLRQQVLKQALSRPDAITARAFVDSYQAQLAALGISATTVGAGTATTAGQAFQGLNAQLAAATGLSGYTAGAARDLTQQLQADLAAHNVTVGS